MLIIKTSNLATGSSFQVNISNNLIERIDLVKYLGVYFDEKLNWSRHAKHVSIQLAKSNVSFIDCAIASMINPPDALLQSRLHVTAIFSIA